MAIKHKHIKSPFGVLDLGSTKLACLIAESDAEGKLHLRGQAIHAAEGIKQGEIIDMDRFSQIVGKTIDAAERNASIKINTIHIVTSAGQPRLYQTKTDIDLHTEVITWRDIQRLASRQAEQATSEQIPKEKTVIQSHLSEYLVDGQGPITNPNGMNGEHLTAISQLLTIARTSYANFHEAVRQNHLELGYVHHSAACTALSCLTDDERDLGTLIIDFGGGTTSLSVHSDGCLRAVGTVKIGGQHITRDIARMLSITTTDAERLKAIEGSVLPSISANQQISQQAFPAKGDNFVLSEPIIAQDSLTLTSGQVIERQFLNDIIRTRLEEILEAVEQSVHQSGLPSLRHFNLAITGGASQLTGLADFLSAYWQKPVSIKSPSTLSGLDVNISGGSFAACIGMSLFVQRAENDKRSPLYLQPSGNGLFSRLREWLKQNI